MADNGILQFLVEGGPGQVSDMQKDRLGTAGLPRSIAGWSRLLDNANADAQVRTVKRGNVGIFLLLLAGRPGEPFTVRTATDSVAECRWEWSLSVKLVFVLLSDSPLGSDARTGKRTYRASGVSHVAKHALS